MGFLASRARPAGGDLLLAGLFAALGALWIAESLSMPLRDGFAPGPGFLPFVYGALLVALAGAALLGPAAPPEAGEEHAAAGGLRRPLAVLAALAAAVAGLEVAGFGPAMFVLMLFLFAVVERQAPLTSALAAAGVAAGLVALFGLWLGVPLPVGPLGF